MIYEINSIGKYEIILLLLNKTQHLCFYCSHKAAAFIANDIKRNLAILEDTLGQCSNDAQIRYDGNTTELKIQLEKLTVLLKTRYFRFSEFLSFRILKNVLKILLIFTQLQ